MFQYNKLSDIQYARFQILPVYLHFGQFWSAGIPTMYVTGNQEVINGLYLGLSMHRQNVFDLHTFPI